MKTTMLLQARRCWLPLAVMCMALPASADQMAVSGSVGLIGSTSGNDRHTGGTLSLAGFDTSLGTLTGVEVSAELDLSFNFTNTGADTQTFISALFDEGNVFLAGQPLGWADSDSPGQLLLTPGQSFNNTDDLQAHESFSSAADLAQFTGSPVLASTQNELFTSSLPDGVTLSSDQPFDLSITYDYTPAVASTPEPASLLLLGTMAASFLALRRRQNAKLSR
jgi:hypothetical protein